MSVDLEQSLTNQRAMEESLLEAQDIIASYEDDKRNITNNDNDLDQLRQVLTPSFLTLSLS